MSKRKCTPTAAPARSTRSSAVRSPNSKDALHSYSDPDASHSSQNEVIKSEDEDAPTAEDVDYGSPRTEDRKDKNFSSTGEWTSVTDHVTKKRWINHTEIFSKAPILPPGSQPSVQAPPAHHESSASPSPEPQGHKRRRVIRKASKACPEPSVEKASPQQKKAARPKTQKKAEEERVSALPSPPAPSSAATSANAVPEALPTDKPPPSAPTPEEMFAFLQANPTYFAQLQSEMASQNQQLMTPQNSQESIKAIEEAGSSDSDEDVEQPIAKRPKTEPRDDLGDPENIYDCSDAEHNQIEQTFSPPRTKPRAQSSAQSTAESSDSSTGPDDDSSSDFEDKRARRSRTASTYFSYRQANKHGIPSIPRSITPAPAIGSTSKPQIVILQQKQPSAPPPGDSSSDEESESDRDPTPFSSSEASDEDEEVENDFEELLEHMDEDHQPLRDPSRTPFLDTIPSLDVAPLSNQQLAEREAARTIPAPTSRSPSTAAESTLFSGGIYHAKRRVASRCETESPDGPAPMTWVREPGFTAVNRQPAVVVTPKAMATQPESDHDSSSSSGSSDEGSDSSDEDSDDSDSDDDAASQPSPKPVQRTIPATIPPPKAALPGRQRTPAQAPIAAFSATQPAHMSTPAPQRAKSKAPSAPRRSAKKAKVAEKSATPRKLFSTDDSTSATAEDAVSQPSSQTSVSEMPSSPPKPILPPKPKHNLVERAMALEAAEAHRLSSLEIGSPPTAVNATVQGSSKGKGVDRALNPSGALANFAAAQEVPSRPSSIQSEGCNNFLQKKFGHPLRIDAPQSEEHGAESASSKRKRKRSRSRSKSKAASVAPTSAETEAATVADREVQPAVQETPVSVPVPAQLNTQSAVTTDANSAQSQPSAAPNQQERRDHGRGNRNRNTSPNAASTAEGQMSAREAALYASLDAAQAAHSSGSSRQAPRQTADEIAILNGFSSAAAEEAAEASFDKQVMQELKDQRRRMMEFFNNRILKPEHAEYYEETQECLKVLFKTARSRGRRYVHGLERGGNRRR